MSIALANRVKQLEEQQAELLKLCTGNFIALEMMQKALQEMAHQMKDKRGPGRPKKEEQ